MKDFEEVYSKLEENSKEIEKNEQEIDKLYAEIKSIEPKSLADRVEVLQKKLKIHELENEIARIQFESDDISIKTIKNELIVRKSSQYPEYDLLGKCYKNNNELEIRRNELECFELKRQILLQSGNKDEKLYSEIMSKIKEASKSVQTLEEKVEDSKQKFSSKFKKDVDFNKSFTDLFYEYEYENAPVRYDYDILELQEEIEDEYFNKLEEFKDDNEIEKYREDVGMQVSSIFVDGLDGTSKELAQVYSEIFVSEINLHNGSIVDSELLGEEPGVLSKVIKQEKGYVLVYENDEGNKIGIRCTRNTQTGKIEVQGKMPNDKSWDGLERAEGLSDDSNSITREQMEIQVVKRNIEKSMQGKKISEIKEITDSKMLEYLNGQNNLQQYSNLNKPSKVYMISTQDKDGNTHYEFVSHDSRNSYTKLSGIRQVETSQSHIATDKYSVNGMKDMQSVDCQFIDKEGNSYYVTHPFGNMPMELSFEEAQKTENEVSNIDTQDYGVNGLFNKTRVNELLRAGYNAMGIGIEKVKSIYNKYRGKTQEQEIDRNERGE